MKSFIEFAQACERRCRSEREKKTFVDVGWPWLPDYLRLTRFWENLKQWPSGIDTIKLFCGKFYTTTRPIKTLLKVTLPITCDIAYIFYCYKNSNL
jgi:hypothetical protein